MKILEQHLNDEKWTVKIIQPSEDLLKKLVQNNTDVSYEIEKPDIVEMLCAATGQDIEQIGLKLTNSTPAMQRRKNDVRFSNFCNYKQIIRQKLFSTRMIVLLPILILFLLAWLGVFGPRCHATRRNKTSRYYGSHVFY